MKINELNSANELDRYIEKRVIKIIDSLGLLSSPWHLGEVTEIISPTKLKVKIDGSLHTQTISCNPDVIFKIKDNVWVIFINGNNRDKFVISKRAI